MTSRSICATDEELYAGYLAAQPDLNPPPEQWPDHPDSSPPYDPDDPDAIVALSADDLFGEPYQANKVDDLEWELWSGLDQDEAEREMLRRSAPAWVFLPPGGELATALEPVRPQTESPIVLIELMKAAARLASWAESMKAGAMATFFRQRKAQYADNPRPAQTDSSGRPVDPERSWAAEVGAALHLSADTAVHHIETALHLTGPLSATNTALRSGALSWSKALSISEATRNLPDESAQAVEAHVLRRAPSQTHANLRKSLRRQVAKHTAAEQADEHREALRERTCKIVPLAGGMAGLWIVHTADKIQQIWVAVQAIADLSKRPTNSATAASPTADVEPTSTGPSTDFEPTTDASPTADAEPTTSADPTIDVSPTADSEPATDPATPSETDANAATSVNTGATPGREPDPTANTPGVNTTPDTDTDTGTGSGGGGGSGGSGGGSGTDADTLADDALGNHSDPATTNTEPGQQPRPRDERTAPQRRADAVTDLFEHILHNGLDWLGRRLPDQHKRRPHIEVVIPASTLLGLDNDPCELTGYGPIPADLGRRIATNGTWRRLLTDPINGTVLEASTTRHDPGTLVSETLLARHPVCAWPGCNRTSRECDRDHGTRFAISGTTSLAGLAPYCQYHHLIKDTPAWGWHTQNHPDGSITLTTPTGHRYTTVPPARGPIQHHQHQPPHTQQPHADDPRQEPPGASQPADRISSSDPPPF
ncbi:DUF222 domain-containing protein [Kribbella sp. NPDC058245]|uniref:HNH endonuclease signature motif containing protein n=1 Tax=Kribbella sp. NPDC058245 TaxID=3346399 RepID=UPI0036F0FA79